MTHTVPVPGEPHNAPHLRVAGPDDLPALHRLAVDFYREDGFATERDALAANLAQLVCSDAALVTVAERAGEIVAFAITTTGFGLENGLIAELEDLYVAPPHRRAGLAGRLVEDAAAWAAGRGCRKLDVVVAPNGQDVSHLHRYYAGRDFVDEGRRLRTRTLRVDQP